MKKALLSVVLLASVLLLAGAIGCGINSIDVQKPTSYPYEPESEFRLAISEPIPGTNLERAIVIRDHVQRLDVFVETPYDGKPGDVVKLRTVELGLPRYVDGDHFLYIQR